VIFVVKTETNCLFRTLALSSLFVYVSPLYCKVLMDNCSFWIYRQNFLVHLLFLSSSEDM